jgi:multiple antibiotic resistance protein
MAEIALTAFATLFVVIDPLGNLPIFVGLTSGADAAHKRRMALKGIVVACAVFALFAVVGGRLLDLLGIGLPAFRTAGGIMLMWIAFEMVFEKRNPRRTATADRIASGGGPSDISVFPIAIPLVSGPGAITSLILLQTRHAGDPSAQAMTLSMLAAVVAIQCGLFLLADRIERVLGDTVIDVFTRLLGILLASLSVQFVFDGIWAGLLSRA